jgi:hypothetical protein
LASSTYLSITNNAILEAGTDLALFASNGSDFTSPPTAMHTRYKKWVANAWRDIQQSAPDWQFSSNKAQAKIAPRIMWDRTDGIANLTTTVPLGAWTIYPLDAPLEILENITVVDFKILANGPLDVANYSRGFVDLDGDEADVIDFSLDVGSTVVSYFDDPSFLFEGVISGWGSYDFFERTQANASAGSVTPPFSIKQINTSTFRIAEYGDTTAEGATNAVQTELAFIPWESFMDYGFDLGSTSPGMPRYVTQDFEGRWRFYPAPNKDYLVSFVYETGVQTLTAYTDVPEGIPEEFVDLIMWRALQYYGLYDEQPSMANTTLTGRADKMAKMLQQRLERQTREKVHFKPKRLW